jgi:nicotinamide riboside transporter PnuC
MMERWEKARELDRGGRVRDGRVVRVDDREAERLDALTTVMSLAAQLMLNCKWLGNWLVWIAADLIYIALYAGKGLWLTSVLYALFLTMCLFGLRQWRASLRATGAAAGDLPTVATVNRS